MTHRSEKVNRSPTHLLHRAGQCAELLFWANMMGRVTPRQFAVLCTVAECEGLSQTDVAERTGIDRMTTADVIRRLVRDGLLQRHRSRADARAYVLKLTDEGRKLLAAAEPVAMRADAHLLNALPEQRRAKFVASLQAIVRSLEGGR